MMFLVSRSFFLPVLALLAESWPEVDHERPAPGRDSDQGRSYYDQDAMSLVEKPRGAPEGSREPTLDIKRT